MTKEREDFYLTLTSDVTSEEVQRVGDFNTLLVKPIRLDPSEYEVGLAEISIPATFANVQDCKVTVSRPVALGVERSSLSLGAIRVDSGRDLVHYVNDTVNRLLPRGEKNKIKLIHDHPGSGRLNIRVERGYTLELNSPLATLLGFGDWESVKILHQDKFAEMITGHPRRLEIVQGDSPFPVNPHKNILNIFIYTDIIAHQYVGDSHVPLLRILPLDGRQTDNVISRTFNPIHYLNLSRGEIISVRVKLCDASGAEFNFSSGKSIVKLHFKRKP